MLRLLLVAACIVTGGLLSLKGPYQTLLFYLWYAYFRPDAWVWHTDLVRSLNISLLVGIFLVCGTIFRGLRTAQVNRQMVPVLLFVSLDVISTLVSPYASSSEFVSLEKFVNSVVVSLVIMLVVNDPGRLRMVLLVIGLSLGLEGAKQGWAMLVLRPGEPNINDVPFLGDNNHVAVGMLMLVPILGSLAHTSRTCAERWLHRVLIVGVLYRALSTYSRGGFLAIGALAATSWVQSRHKVRLAAGGGLVLAVLVSAFPDAFWDRMKTIPIGGNSYDEPISESENLDGSIQGRLHCWRIARAMAASHPLLGIGHLSFPLAYDQFDSTAGAYGRKRAVHSAWFGVLAEVGYPGFALFAIVLLVAIADCVGVILLARRHPELASLGHYAHSLVAAFVAAAVGGTFVTFEYSEMLWHYVALAAALRLIAKREAARVMAPAEAAEEEAVVRRWSPVPSGAAY